MTPLDPVLKLCEQCGGEGTIGTETCPTCKGEGMEWWLVPRTPGEEKPPAISLEVIDYIENNAGGEEN